MLLKREFVDEQRWGGAEQGSAVPEGCEKHVRADKTVLQEWDGVSVSVQRDRKGESEMIGDLDKVAEGRGM